MIFADIIRFNRIQVHRYKIKIQLDTIQHGYF
jgi:hypothetical protein